MINSGPLLKSWTIYNALRVLCLKDVDFVEIRIKKEGPAVIITETDPMPSLGFGVDSYDVEQKNGYSTTETMGVLLAWKQLR